MSDTYEVVIQKLKRVAKNRRKEAPQLAQHQALNWVASLLGYNNWSLLQKHARKMSASAIDDFHDDLYLHPILSEELAKQNTPIDTKIAAEEMRVWVSANFSRLIEFAYYDSESENGFAWPSADINHALQENFDGKYPIDLIEDVATDLESDGPWGEDPYEMDND